MERIEVAVVGGGVVGLAVACAVAERRRSVCLIERRPRFGLEASTHNSGVIHAGLYYPPDSLKARLSVDGRERLYRFCATHAIPHARCGKLIVATDETETGRLEALAARGRANGVELELVEAPFIRRLEPRVRGRAAIWSPTTGIVEAEALIRTLVRLAGERDVALLPATAIVAGRPGAEGIELRTTRERFTARVVVNAAGLYADEVSAALGGETFRI